VGAAGERAMERRRERSWHLSFSLEEERREGEIDPGMESTLFKPLLRASSRDRLGSSLLWERR